MQCPLSVRREIELYAVAVVRGRRGEIMLLKFSGQQGYSLPMARVEFGESSRHAMSRQLGVSLGEPLASEEPGFFYEAVFEPGFCKRHAVFLIYSYSPKGGEDFSPRKIAPENCEVRWVAQDKAAGMRFSCPASLAIISSRRLMDRASEKP
jgi:ADP-ribose pyrophosphatase YjhB (NUDIX family)